MATVIVCPNCQTRYETAAVIPPEGRKVRCSKCSHVWQAKAEVEPARPPIAPVAPAPQAPPAAAPGPAPRPPFAPAPRATPAAPSPAMAPRPQPMRPPIPPAEPRAEPQQPAADAASMGGFGAMPQTQPSGGQTISPPFSAGGDASFDVSDEFQADIPETAPGAMPPMGGNDWSQDLGSYDGGAPAGDELGQANVPIAGKGRKAKVLPGVAIGWGVLVLLLVLVAALFAASPKTVVSAVPGAAKLYAMLGMPVNLTGLEIQDVRYTWEDLGQGPVLRIEGHIVNVSGNEVAVPPVIVALQDTSGAEVTAVTAEVGTLAPGMSVPFVAQIPAPSTPVANLQVRFAEAS